MSIPREIDHLALPIDFLAQGKTSGPMRLSNPGPFGPESYALPLRHTGSLQKFPSHLMARFLFVGRYFFRILPEETRPAGGLLGFALCDETARHKVDDRSRGTPAACRNEPLS